MMAATSVITERSPFIVRTSFSVAADDRAARRLGRGQRHQEGDDGGLGLCARDRRRDGVQAALRSDRRQGDRRRLRVPLANPDFAPFLQRVAEAKPDALLGFVPAGVGTGLHAPVRRTRTGQVGHPVHRRGQPDGGRHRQPDRRCRARHHHLAALFGRPRQPGEQELRRRLQEGQRRHAAQHGGGAELTTACT